MWSETAPQGLNAAAWLAHRAAIVRDPSVDRYYSFQDLSGSDGHFKNVAGWQDHLDVAVVDPALAESAFTLVEGRWPWKKAVRLDHGPRAVVFMRDMDPSSWRRNAVWRKLRIGRYAGRSRGWRLGWLATCHALPVQFNRL